MRINQNLLKILFLIVGFTVLSACQSGASKTGALVEAYKNLYDAVKSKDTEKIKANMSKDTLGFVSSVGEMQKKTPEEMLKNGLIQSTRAEKLPPTRNERIKENMGALEVQDPNGNWEDVPFVLEDGRWKLAVGDLFKGTYKKPAPSQAETEANNNVPQIMPGTDITNTNAIPKPPVEKTQPAANKPEKK